MEDDGYDGSPSRGGGARPRGHCPRSDRDLGDRTRGDRDLGVRALGDRPRGSRPAILPDSTGSCCGASDACGVEFISGVFKLIGLLLLLRCS